MHPRSARRWACLLLVSGVAGCACGATEDAAPRVFRAARLGARLPVASEPGLVYVVAAGPGGARAAVLRALDANGSVLASDASSGPLGLPRLAVPPGTRFVVLSAARGEPKAGLHVYANDARDDDGDGLGHALEHALGTCDAPDQAHCARSRLAVYYARVRGGTRDSDRDGLLDGDELWGVAGQPLLDLPRFGADPLHKDVFVEVDRAKGVAAPGLSEDDLLQVAALFEQGRAAVLRNPDGLPGIRLHVDIGFEPVDARHRSLMGNWGGSGRSAGNYKKARQRDFSAGRAGYFRYGVLVRSGVGQTKGDAFVVNRDRDRVAVFAHELAHTLGLHHHGEQAWGAVNCKPNYVSIINYAYQNMPEVGFSTRAGAALNPAGVIEQGAVDTKLAALLRAPPFELDVIDRGAHSGVDWNRDGRISDEPVRAGLTWATYKSCDAAGVGRTALAKDVKPASPALVAVDGVLHALWIDADGALAHRSATLQPCAASEPKRCTQIGEVGALGGHTGLRAIAAAGLPHGQVALVHVTEDGGLGVSALTFERGGLDASQPVRVAAARTRHAPAVAWMAVDPDRYGVARVLSVLFVAEDAHGTLMQASAPTPEGPFLVRTVLDDALRPITTPLPPALAQLGTGELCGAFADHESLIRLYCYDPRHDLWRDHSARAFYAGLGPQSFGPLSLAYHRYRIASGTPIDADEGRGALYLSFSAPAHGDDTATDNPQLLVSEWLDAAHPAATSIQFRWRGNVINQWTHLAADTALVLYEDGGLQTLTGAMVRRAEDRLKLELLPVVDGSFDAELGGGDDFAVMERGICTQLRGAACGGPETSPK